VAQERVEAVGVVEVVVLVDGLGVEVLRVGVLEVQLRHAL
jgi:hypothetical protein